MLDWSEKASPLLLNGIPEDNTLVTRYAYRLNVMLHLAIVSWSFFLLFYGFLGRWQNFLTHIVIVLVMVGLRAWVATKPELSILSVITHLTAGATVLGMAITAVKSGHSDSVMIWYVAIAPLLVGYLEGVLASFLWGAISVAAILLVWFLKLNHPIAPEFVPSGTELFVGQAFFVFLIMMFAVAMRRATEHQVAGLKERETRLKEQATLMQKQAEELSSARDQALAAVEAKSSFLANMTHELRTPLNGVLGMSRILLHTELNKEQHNILRTIQRSGASLLATINNILDFSKIEAGSLEMVKAEFDLRDCVEDALELFFQQTWEKNIDLSYEFAPDVPIKIIGDVNGLRQVLVNLVGNAVKFTSSGSITVKVHRNVDEHLSFEIHDTGIGISEEQQEGLFEAFTQADASITQRYGGTGLGLVISRRLIHLMGGDISLSSALGKGSTFSFHIMAEHPVDQFELSDERFLLKRVALVDPQIGSRQWMENCAYHWKMSPRGFEQFSEFEAALKEEEEFDVVVLSSRLLYAPGSKEALQRIKNANPEAPWVLLTSLADTKFLPQVAELGFSEVLYLPLRYRQFYSVFQHVLFSEESLSTFAVTHATTHLQSVLPLSILVVEDNSVNQLVVCKILKRLGFVPDLASNGREALELVHDNLYDLILMDIRMPEMDGLEATRRIRALETLSQQPYIVAVTANVDAKQREQCKLVGMEEFIGKPIQFEEVVDALWNCGRHFGMLNHPNLLSVESAPLVSPVLAVSTRPDVAAPLLDHSHDNNNALSSFDQLVALCDRNFDSLEKLITSHVENVGVLIQQMETAILEKDVDDLSLAAHSLKSSTAMFDSVALSELARELEVVLEHLPSWSEVRTKVSEISNEAVRSEQHLKKKYIEIVNHSD